MKMKKYGYVVMALTMLAALLMAGCGSSVTGKTQVAAVTFANSTLLVSTSELAATIDNTNQAIIDVRSATDYAAGHINECGQSAPRHF